MPDPLQALLAAGAVPTVAFAPTSRYAGVGLTAYMKAGVPGQESERVPHLRRRLCPHPERLVLLYEYTAVEGDRRDLIAARQLGDVELWWRLADANGVIDAHELTEPVGRRLRVALAEGIPGADGG